MLNYIWGAMIIIGIVYGAFQGNLGEIGNAAINSGKEAVTLCIGMVGVISLWTGIMEIAEKSGMVTSITKKIQPFIQFMFPEIPKGHKAREYISINVVANILGLGWAATPAGLLAMKELKKLNEGRETASTSMCSFLILNVSSLQLIPINMIAYRSQYGSVNPTGIVAPAIIATLISTMVGILYAKIKARTS